MLIPTLKKEKELLALGAYFSYRFNLLHNLEELPKEKCWKSLVASEIGRDALLWSLEKLGDIYCHDARDHVGFELIRGPHEKPGPYTTTLRWDIAQGPIQPGGAPLPLGNLRLLDPLTPAQEIINQLKALGDQKKLDTAKSFSNDYALSIFKWEVMRFRLIREAGFHTAYSAGETMDTSKDIGDLSLKWLTLTSLQELAPFELPDITKFEEVKAGLGKFGINIPWVPAGSRPSAIALGLQSALGLCTIYFFLFFYEASRIPGFPFPGTLFGAFSRTFISRILFLTLVTLPPVSSALLTIRAPEDTGINAALSLLILLISIGIARLAYRMNLSQA